MILRGSSADILTIMVSKSPEVEFVQTRRSKNKKMRILREISPCQ